ncbi:MAG: hypothetical protein GXP14_00055 [Gammaproteobacteria bacterium]|nr:hypothetical protein [Gammaproteobacteria bacterium]
MLPRALYIRKIAISESRICTVSEYHVTFDYKDYRDNKDKQMRFDGTEFLRRFLLRVLPWSFMHICYYGFLSSRSRRQKLAIIRQCLQVPPGESKTITKTKQDTGINSVTYSCPKCQKGRLRVCYEILVIPLYGR